MNKKLVIIIGIVAALLVLAISVGGFAISSYNGLVEQEETINTASADISTQLQRRADLIPNFVATVKGYSDYEKETYTAVTQARSAVANANGPAEQAEANEQLNGAISLWVNAVTEAYPELKANTQYLALQDELAGTENRIAVARKDYNAAVKKYNVSIKKFPKSIIASMFGFDSYEYFEADSSAEKVPEVSFEK